MNARIEQYLRAYVNYAQSDWIRFLPSAEFALNNHNSFAIRLSPFFAVGQHPRSGSELSAPLDSPSAPASIYFERLDAEDLVENFQKIDNFLTENIELHAAEYETQANKSRIAARNFQPGDKVWLNLKNVKSLRPSRKLDYKNGGPFKIKEAIGNYAFKLDLPKSLKIHPDFHVSLLSPVACNPLPGQKSSSSPPLKVENEYLNYEVERVIGSRRENGELNYLVRWKGYGPENDWLIPASKIKGFENLVQEFHSLNPSEPHPDQQPPKNNNFKPRRSSARFRRG